MTFCGNGGGWEVGEGGDGKILGHELDKRIQSLVPFCSKSILLVDLLTPIIFLALRFLQQKLKGGGDLLTLCL
jgi:hypothetical protein